ncbi:hypothetical protein CEXT_312662 [Caerostris extrusa]|uniref:Serine/arginine-rich splicing factor 7 n=1 Tax=Caerostris extrusa TaxID=172846 RepID=A0AAV4UIH5_CAEEX|nr:hypothetical protein CEXT_312662 [Caerostris extrusa]
MPSYAIWSNIAKSSHITTNDLQRIKKKVCTMWRNQAHPEMSSRYRNSGPLDCKVYVGELGNSGTRHELEDAFSYYGPLRNVWVARNPPGFAFVEFEDSRDARDAVRGLDGKILCGRRVRVELSSGKSRSSYRPPPRYNPDERCYECGERGHYARDCRGPKRGRSRSCSRSPRRRSRSRSRSRSASRSPVRGHTGGSRSRSGSRSR